MITVIQHKLRYYGHVLRKDANDWVKKCVDFEVEGVRPKGRSKKTWSEVIEKDCHQTDMQGGCWVDHRKWRI